MILYADSSALTKYYLKEADSALCKALIGQAETVGTAEIARAEVSAAICKALRMGLIVRADAENALARFRAEWSRYVRIHISGPLVARADELAWEQALRGYDAVHLAAALIWQEKLAVATALLTYDRELARAARAVGVKVLPELL